MSSLFAEISPYEEFLLPVSDIHTLEVEQSGNPKGKPVVILHGGPGGGLRPSYRQYFDPNKWRIVQFSQRGCGKSTPHAELRENTTWDLIEDIEKIRKYLQIEKWCVFGGSWGSTLALAYGIKHPDSVEAFFLRGIFLLRDKEIQWFYQKGASEIFPDKFEEYVKPINKEKRNNLVNEFYLQLTSEDLSQRLQAAKAWSVWEGSTSRLIPNQTWIDETAKDEFALAFARIECHYFINKGFFDDPNYILNNISVINEKPCLIVHGRYDVVCPLISAWELHKKWPNADFKIIEDAGHSVEEPGIQKYLVEYIKKYH